MALSAQVDEEGHPQRVLRRRIVQHGPATLTVSLPAEWIHEYGLCKGDEVGIERLHDGLFLSCGHEPKGRAKHIDICHADGFITTIISGLYIAGHDSITITCSDTDAMHGVHQAIGGKHIGFEVVDETATTITIHRVSETTPENFRAVFRRTCFSLLALAQATAAVHNEETAAYAAMRHEEFSKYARFCRRIVNHRTQRDMSPEMAVYQLLTQLERIGDAYAAIAKKQPVYETAAALERTNSMLREFFDIFFDFSIQRLQEHHKKHQDATVALPQDSESFALYDIIRTLQRMEETILIIRA